MTTFHLPDLGEGLQEAEIVAWHVKEGDTVKADQLMVSVETAKAVVEVPCPYSGKIAKLYAKAGEVVETHKPLVEFELPEGVNAPPAAHVQAPAGAPEQGPSVTVVGRMAISDQELIENAIAGGAAAAAPRTRVRAAPAVRMLAKRLNIDLTRLKGTGRHGLITINDVMNSEALQRLSSGHARAPLPPLGERLAGPFEPLQGARRAMAQSMTLSRDEIAMVTIFDDADIHGWPARADMTARIIRALVAGVQNEPALNAVFDPSGPARRVFEHVDVGIAVDIGDKLLVPVIRDAQNKGLAELREELNRLKQATRDRTLTAAELRDYTITLTNFGTLAGRYATPLVVPPTVAILGTGKVHHDVVATEKGGIEVHARIPLSLSFDHRCITGGEACRFLAGVIKDLETAA